MTKSRNINKPRASWTPEKIAIVIARYPHERTETIAADLGVTVTQVYALASRPGINLKKTPEYLASPGAHRLNGQNPNSVKHRFQKGIVPHNKGKKGISYPGSEATQFKKGQLSPRCKAMLKQVGELRINTDGYLERKITMGLSGARRWKAEHRLVWEAANGPMPPGYIVIFRKGMKTTNAAEITLDRLELVSYQENMRRNSFHNNYPKEVGKLIQLRGALQRKINRRMKDERPASDTAKK